MTLHSKKNIEQAPDDSPSPLGERLWRPTSMVRLQAPLSEARGVLRGGAGVVHSMRGDKCVTRPYVRPKDPKTPPQLRRRTMLSTASAAWSPLPPDVRRAWEEYAHQYLSEKLSDTHPASRGQDAFVSAQFYRLGMGFPVAPTAPTTPPPSARIASLELAAGAPPGALRFRVTHEFALTAGLFLLFEITPPLGPGKRRPRNNEFRWASQQDSQSFLPLGPTAATYDILHPTFSLAGGDRFWARVTVISAGGIVGPQVLVVPPSGGGVLNHEPATPPPEGGTTNTRGETHPI